MLHALHQQIAGSTLCHPDEDLAAFSPDAIAGVIEEILEGDSNYVALVEMKSKCFYVTLTQDMELVGEFGEYQEIIIEEDPQLFKASIPDASYRCQLLLHDGEALDSVNYAFYVVASLRKVNLCRACSRWVVDTGTEPFCNCNFGLAKSALDYRGGCASKDNIQSRVPRT